MFERLKRALVESFVGAVALGYLFAQAILHFVNIFASPVVGWVTRNEYREMIPASAGFSLRDTLPELIRFFLLLLVGYVLLRWLYFNPLKREMPAPGPSPKQEA
jgi:predicted Kef-type K+ transport protein